MFLEFKNMNFKRIYILFLSKKINKKSCDLHTKTTKSGHERS